MLRKWSDYKHRFLPWIYLNFTKHAVDAKAIDKPSLIDTVYTQLENFSASPQVNHRYLLKSSGFGLSIKKSSIHSRGVFVREGRVTSGSIVGYYPGTIYTPGDSVFLQSISNSFLFQCSDGRLVDGKNTGYSRMIYRSCGERNRLGPYRTCDTTWLTATDSMVNPIACGQLVNNGGVNHANVEYCEIDIDLRRVKLSQRCLIPNIQFGEPAAHMRLVVLVAVRDIVKGEELLSAYFSLC